MVTFERDDVMTFCYNAKGTDHSNQVDRVPECGGWRIGCGHIQAGCEHVKFRMSARLMLTPFQVHSVRFFLHRPDDRNKARCPSNKIRTNSVSREDGDLVQQLTEIIGCLLTKMKHFEISAINRLTHIWNSPQTVAKRATFQAQDAHQQLRKVPSRDGAVSGRNLPTKLKGGGPDCQKYTKVAYPHWLDSFRDMIALITCSDC